MNKAAHLFAAGERFVGTALVVLIALFVDGEVKGICEAGNLAHIILGRIRRWLINIETHILLGRPGKCYVGAPSRYTSGKPLIAAFVAISLLQVIGLVWRRCPAACQTQLESVCSKKYKIKV